MGLPSWISNPVGYAVDHTPSWAPPAAPGSLQAAGNALNENNWSNPFSSGANSFDMFAGGASSSNPYARMAGRTVGSVFALGTGGEALFGSDAAPSFTAEGEGGNAAYYGAGGGAGGGTGAFGAGEVGFGSDVLPAAGTALSTGGGLFSGLSSFLPSMGQFGAGLGLASSGYGLYLSDQARRERQKQVQRQREYQDKLNALIANPGSVTSLPGYQFRLDQGSQAVARRMASLGYGAGSGNLGTGLTKYGQDYATGELERQEGLLSQLYGMSGPNINVRDPYEMAGRSLASLGYGVGRLNG